MLCAAASSSQRNEVPANECEHEELCPTTFSPVPTHVRGSDSGLAHAAWRVGMVYCTTHAIRYSTQP